MTRMRFVHGTEGSLTVEGHAGFDVRGRDIVCAAVSTLCNGLIATLRVLAWHGHCKGIEEAREDGVLRVSYREGDEAARDAFLLYEELARSYAREYPEHLIVE